MLCVPPTLGLVLVVGAGAVVPAVRLAAAVGGVLVLDVDVLEMPLPPSCLVGLLTGLLKPLRPDLAPGVGLAVSMIALALLPGAGHWVQQEQPAALLEHLLPFIPA